MKYSEIIDYLPKHYPKNCTQAEKEALSSSHNAILEYGNHNIVKSRKSKKRIIDAVNAVSYAVITGEDFDLDFDKDTIVVGPKHISVEQCWGTLKSLYIDLSDIVFDIEMSEPEIKSNTSSTPKIRKTKALEKAEPEIETPKEYLYLKAPQYPRFDATKYWFNTYIGKEQFYMHPSLPIIPEKQADISCTTEVDKMTDSELLRLFPNHLIRTRAPIMYEPLNDIHMDKDLGLLIPIEGYTSEQIRENIIKYPHLFQLTRIYNNEELNFYKHIEIDGKLCDIIETWDSLPISRKLPKTVEFIKEYVARKYLLDRDNGVQQKFPLRGSLEPYLTLFAPPEFYTGMNPIELAKTCVKTRIKYLQSRNPFLERYQNVKQGRIPSYETISCPFKQYCRKAICKNVCADWAEIQYLLERNNLDKNSEIYSTSAKDFQKLSEWLTVASTTHRVVISDNTVDTASRLTYAAICQYWKGNAFHCAVYNLNFMEYLNRTQQSWAGGNDEDLEYINIFIQKAKVLIISNIDFVQFKDYQAQMLLNIVNNRKIYNQSTITVAPKLNSLVGSGTFFARMKEIFGKEVLD